MDPIRYSLLFERFLNPERVSMPDIDVDFCYERRQEVIDYVVRKYGKDRVVQIVTFGTMAAKGVIRDVGRVMDLPYAMCDSIAKMIPNELGITISKALKMNPELRGLYESNPEVTKLIDMSLRLEGTAAAYVYACSRCGDQSEIGGRVCAALERLRWFRDDTVYHDDTGGAGASEDGLPRTQDTDCNPGCREKCGAFHRKRTGYGSD